MTSKLVKVLAGLLVALLAGVTGASGMDHVALVCVRDSGSNAPCQVIHTSPFRAERRFPGSIGEVRVRERMRSGKKGAPVRFAVVLLDRRGDQVEFGTYETKLEAETLANRVRGFVEDRAAAPFRVDEARGFAPYVAFLIAFGALGWSVFTAIRPSSATPLAPKQSVLPRARRFAAGYWTFLLVIPIAVLGNILLELNADHTQGWLEIQAETRCTFEGFDMLPGASMREAKDPGRYCARVFNPDVAGHFEELCFDVKLGETTVVRCRPGAGR